MPLSMVLAQTVAMDVLSALILRGALAMPPKPTEAMMWSKAQFRIYFLHVGRVSTCFGTDQLRHMLTVFLQDFCI